MFYFLNYFTRRTRHHFVGPLNAYAYTNEDDTRAFINLRMNVLKVRPYASVDDHNRIIPSNAIRMNSDDYENDTVFKLKYFIYLFVWQNIDDENWVRQERLNKEPFAHYLSDLFEDLRERRIIPRDLDDDFNLVRVNERIVRRQRNNRLAERTRDVEYLWNDKIPRVDFEDPNLASLDWLCDDDIPIPRYLLAIPIFVDVEAEPEADEEPGNGNQSDEE
ncbi:hypothetical protein MBANPS3_001468 [Mucor bainieri]